MKDKEKQIEEKIKEIAECNKESCKDCKIICTYYSAIKLFCEKYLPKDSVALTREVLNDLENKCYDTGFDNGCEIARKRAVKETAEKILRKIYHWYEQDDDYTFTKMVGEIKKEFGVEIKE